MKILYRIVIAFALFLFVPHATLADGISIQPVQFAKGKLSTTIKGVVKGDQAIDYTLRGKAGQTMSVDLKSNKGGNSFNVLPPGSEAAIAIGDTLGNKWTGQLPTDGEYRIRVFLNRSAARRNETAKYTLTVGITGHFDAKVAGTNYHATGTVPCSVGTDPEGSSNCSFGVVRSGPGKAEVHLAPIGFDVILHKDAVRVLHFSGNSVTSPNPDAKVQFTKQDDNWSVSVDDFNFYIIPDAVISGG